MEAILARHFATGQELRGAKAALDEQTERISKLTTAFDDAIRSDNAAAAQQPQLWHFTQALSQCDMAVSTFQVDLSGVSQTKSAWQKCNNSVKFTDPIYRNLTWKVQMVWSKYLVDTANAATACHERKSDAYEEHKNYMPKLYVTLNKAENWEVAGKVRVSILAVNGNDINPAPSKEEDVELEAFDEHGKEFHLKDGFIAYPSDHVLVKIEHMVQPALTLHV